MYSLPQGRHWASSSSSDPSPAPPTQFTWGKISLPRVLVTHLPRIGGLWGGYLEMEEGSVGCQCHSDWKGFRIS